jgi:hypothetical protein
MVCAGVLLVVAVPLTWLVTTSLEFAAVNPFSVTVALGVCPDAALPALSDRV